VSRMSRALHYVAGLVIDMAVTFVLVIVAAGAFGQLDRELPYTYYPDHMTGTAVGRYVGEGGQP